MALRTACIALALARSAALQAAPRPRTAATRAGAAPSLFDAPATDELETLEALEEALEAKAALYRGDSRTKSPAWDAAFWREFDGEAQCRAVESADAAAGAPSTSKSAVGAFVGGTSGERFSGTASRSTSTAAVLLAPQPI